jgi:GLPGLI family protein
MGFVPITVCKYLKISLICLILFPIEWGCRGGSSKGKAISEGVIEFEAVAIDPNNPMADLAPSKMVEKFKNHKIVYEMSAGMGLMNMSVISDYNAKTVTELIKLLNKKYASITDADDIKKELANSKIKIQKTNETKFIAGYRCKKAIVSFEDDSHPKFDVYYTDEIDVEKPNWNNGFGEIDGVLMEYQVKRHGLELRFTARKVSQSNIEDIDFETPGDYKIISQKELEDLFAGMQ